MGQKLMTKQEVTTAADAVFEEFLKGHGEKFQYLRGRWQDEKQYEDWKDYDKVIRERLAEYNVVKVIKVGVVIRTEEFDLQIKFNMNDTRWRVVKLNNVEMTA